MDAIYRRCTSTGVAIAASLVTLIASSIYALSLGGKIRYWDEETYVMLARNLAAGHGYDQFDTGPTAYRPPGYPLLLSVLHLLGVGPLGYRLLNSAFLAITVYLVFLLGRRIFGTRAGAFAAVIAACYPLFLYTAGALYPQTMAGMLLVGGLVLTSRFVLEPGTPRARSLVAAGLVWGALILTVPTFGASFVAALVWVFWRLRAHAVRIVAVLVLSAAVLPGAWCVRNAVQMHAFIPISTNNGINLLQGNSPVTTVNGGATVDTSGYEQEARRRNLDEVQESKFYQDEAIKWIKADPARAASLYVKKVLNHFNYRNDYATGGHRSVLQDLASALSFYPLVFLALLGLGPALLGRGRKGEGLLYALIFGNAFVMAVFYTRLRFRIPLDPLLIVVAAGTLTHYVSRWVGGGGQPSENLDDEQQRPAEEAEASRPVTTH